MGLPADIPRPTSGAAVRDTGPILLKKPVDEARMRVALLLEHTQEDKVYLVESDDGTLDLPVVEVGTPERRRQAASVRTLPGGKASSTNFTRGIPVRAHISRTCCATKSPGAEPPYPVPDHPAGMAQNGHFPQ